MVFKFIKIATLIHIIFITAIPSCNIKKKCEEVNFQNKQYLELNSDKFDSIGSYIIEKYTQKEDTIFTIRFSRERNEVGGRKFFKIEDSLITNFIIKNNMDYIEISQNTLDSELWLVPLKQNNCFFSTYIYDPKRVFYFYNKDRIKEKKIIEINNNFYLALLDKF